MKSRGLEGPPHNWMDAIVPARKSKVGNTRGVNKYWGQGGGGEIRISTSRAVYADFVFT